MSEKSTCSSASTCTKESCEGCTSKNTSPIEAEPVNRLSSVKKVIGIVSGKGGWKVVCYGIPCCCNAAGRV